MDKSIGSKGKRALCPNSSFSNPPRRSRWVCNPPPFFSFGLMFLVGAIAGIYIILSGPDLRGQGVATSGLVIGLIVIGIMTLWEVEARLIARQLGWDPAMARWRNSLSWLGAVLTLAGFIPIYALASGHPAMIPAVRWYVLGTAGASLLAFKLLLFVPRCAQWPDAAEQHANTLLAALIAVYVVVAIGLGAYRWRILTLGNVDSAIVIQSLRYTLAEGRLFFNTLEKASHLAVHVSPIYFLLLPIYMLCRTPEVILIVLPPLLISVSAIPLFKLTRSKIGALAALCLTAAYLLCPYVMARAVGDFYEMTILPAVLLPAFYYYDKRRWGLFLLFVILSLSVKESLAATILIFAIYSLLKRRSLAWVLTPAFLSILSLTLSFFVILPVFGAGVITSRAEAVLGPFGGSPQELLRYLFRQPAAFLRAMFSLPKIALVYQLFQPLLFIPPLLSSEILFSLPALALNLLAQGGSVGIRAWESAIFGPVLFTAAATGIAYLSRRLRHLGGRQDNWQRLPLFLAITIFFVTISCAPYWFRLDDYRPRPYLAAQKTAIALIPREASVSAPDYTMARFAERPYLQLQTGQPFWAEYHIVDMHWIALVRGHRIPETTAQEYADLVTRTQQGQTYEGLRLLWAADGLYVFQRIKE